MSHGSEQSSVLSYQPMIQFRYSHNLHAFVEARRKENNQTASEAYRAIFNAGVQAVYNVKIVNNEIVSS